MKEYHPVRSSLPPPYTPPWGGRLWKEGAEGGSRYTYTPSLFHTHASPGLTHGPVLRESWHDVLHWFQNRTWICFPQSWITRSCLQEFVFRPDIKNRYSVLFPSSWFLEKVDRKKIWGRGWKGEVHVRFWRGRKGFTFSQKQFVLIGYRLRASLADPLGAYRLVGKHSLQYLWASLYSCRIISVQKANITKFHGTYRPVGMVPPR